MGFGPFSSSSDSRSDTRFYDNKIGADASQVQSNRINQGDKGRAAQTNAAGSVAILGAGNTVTLNSTDFGAVRGAFDFAAVALSKGSQIASEAIGASNATNQQVKDLAETKLTDGANLSQRTVIIAVTVLAALAALVFWLRK